METVALELRVHRATAKIVAAGASHRLALIRLATLRMTDVPPPWLVQTRSST